MLLQVLQDFDPTIAEEFGYAVTQGPSFLGVPLLDATNLLHLLLRFAFNLLVSWILVRFFYYKKSGRRDYFLTFMLFSSAMFLLLFLMENVKLQIGFTLGLFAIFGMIRYRTETVPIREMTYLFVIIALSVINGIALNVSYAELVVANVLIVALTAVCENVSIPHTASRIVLYDRIELIVPGRQDELKADLEKRLGLAITSLEVGSVDFLSDSAYVKVYYKLGKGEMSTISEIVKVKENI